MAIDAWHWHLGGGRLDQVESLTADRVVTVALAQAEEGATAADATLAARRLPSDPGPIDLAALLTTLAQLRYDGPVTPAPDKSHLAGPGRDKIVKSASAALDAVWKAAGLNVAGKLAAVSGR